MSDSQSRFPLPVRSGPFFFRNAATSRRRIIIHRLTPCATVPVYLLRFRSATQIRVSRGGTMKLSLVDGGAWQTAYRVGGALNQPIYLFILQSKVRHAFDGVSLSVRYLLSALQFCNVSWFRTRLIVSPTSRDNMTRRSHESTIFPWTFLEDNSSRDKCVIFVY